MVSMAGACREINRERLTGRGKRGWKKKKTGPEDMFQESENERKGQHLFRNAKLL